MTTMKLSKANRELADNIARNWVKFADDTIKAERKPIKLSDLSKDSVYGYISNYLLPDDPCREPKWRISDRTWPAIRSRAVTVAKNILNIRRDSLAHVIEHFNSRAKAEAKSSTVEKGHELLAKAERMYDRAGCNKATGAAHGRVKALLIGRAEKLKMEALEMIHS